VFIVCSITIPGRNASGKASVLWPADDVGIMWDKTEERRLPRSALLNDQRRGAFGEEAEAVQREERGDHNLDDHPRIVASRI
jgi:hypothetical protein